jgi:hypothetical protein
MCMAACAVQLPQTDLLTMSEAQLAELVSSCVGS